MFTTIALSLALITQTPPKTAVRNFWEGEPVPMHFRHAVAKPVAPVSAKTYAERAQLIRKKRARRAAFNRQARLESAMAWPFYPW